MALAVGGCLDTIAPWKDGVPTSFYHEGKTNADETPFYADGETCAHRWLPFGTMLLVTNLKNGLSATCEIRDRGPATWTGKDLDLSRGVARKVDLLVDGITTTRVDVLSVPDYPMGPMPPRLEERYATAPAY